MAGQTVIVSVLADTKKFSQGFDDAGKKAGTFGGTFKKVAAGAALAAAGVAVGVGKFIKDSIDAAAASEVVAAQTAAVVESTGKAAGKSADQIGDLALKLSNLTGIDDEVVQGAENILLTFTNIKGDQFDQATKSALDLSTALGTDANSAAQQLGKALNDPIAGVTKLARSGVTFTDQQKDQIKNYVEMGKTAQAQQIILDEVQKEFGGSAEAYGATFEGTIEKVKNAFGNIQETIGGAFLPVLTQAGGKLAGFLQNLGESDKFTAFVDSLASGISSLLAGGGPLGGFVSTIVQAASAFSPLSAILTIVGQNAKGLEPIFTLLAQVIGTTLVALLPIVTSLIQTLSGVFAALLPSVLPIVQALAGVFVQVLPTLIPLIQLLAGVFSQLVTAVLPLVTAILGLVAPILQLIGPLLTPLIQLLTVLLTPILQLVTGIVSLLVPVLTFLITVLAKVAQFILSVVIVAVKALVAFFTGNFTPVIRTVSQFFVNAWNNAKAVFTATINIIIGVVAGLISRFSAGFNAIVRGATGFVNGVRNAINTVGNVIRGIQNTIYNALGNAGQWLVNVGRNVIVGFVNGIANSFSFIYDIARNVGNAVMNTIKNVLGIHSPSREMKELGVYSIEGFVQGLSNLKPVKAAAKAIGNAVTGGVGFDQVAFSGGGSLRGGAHYTVNVSTLNPSAEAGRVIVQSIDDHNRLNGKR